MFYHRKVIQWQLAKNNTKDCYATQVLPNILEGIKAKCLNAFRYDLILLALSSRVWLIYVVAHATNNEFCLIACIDLERENVDT